MRILLGSGLPGDGAGQGRGTLRQTVRAGQSLRAGGWQTDGPGRSPLAFTLELSEHLSFQVLEALLDLHSRRIVHRDLKPENLLFYDNSENSKIVVVDFGLSEYEEELNEESPVCGTATYLAPEVKSPHSPR